jgi:hypothetical protein
VDDRAVGGRLPARWNQALEDIAMVSNKAEVQLCSLRLLPASQLWRSRQPTFHMGGCSEWQSLTLFCNN